MRTIRKEIRKRAFFAWVFLILFLAFNAFMAAWLWLYSETLSQVEVRLAAAPFIGGMIGTSAIAFFWAAGAIVLGLLAVLTRSRKTIVEETSVRDLEAFLSILASSESAKRAPTNFDRARWDALLKRDPQLATVANKLGPLGQKWVNKFAAEYLAINDRNHLPTLVSEIIADARKEFEQQQTVRGR